MRKNTLYKKISDRIYTIANAESFIESVKVKDIKNFPKETVIGKFTDEQLFDYWNRDIEEPDKRTDLPEAVIEIKVTSPEWIEHLNPGDI